LRFVIQSPESRWTSGRLGDIGNLCPRYFNGPHPDRSASESHRGRLWHPVTLGHVHDVDLHPSIFGMTAVGHDLVLAAHTGVMVLRLNDHLFPPPGS
jgi:hypothetical protein